MIFVQGEPTVVAKSKITSTFQSLLPNEDMAREYLNEVSRDLARLTDACFNAVPIIGRDRSGELIYDIESILSIRETVKNLEKQLKPLPPKQSFSEEWAAKPVADKFATFFVGFVFFGVLAFFMF
jgi:hypothetical protein